MQIKDAQKVLNVSRTTMMAWIEEGRFPGAEKGENPRDPWLIPVDDVEKVRLQLIADLHTQLAKISRPAMDYSNGRLVAKVA